MREEISSRVVNSVRLGAHWCYFQSQVAPWKIFVRLCKMVKKAFKRKNIEKKPEKIKNVGFFPYFSLKRAFLPFYKGAQKFFE